MIKEGLTFDDVLLIPKYSEISSRSTVDLSIKINKIKTNFKHPIIAANMKSLMGEEMIISSIHNGGLTILHRYDDDPFSSQMKISNSLKLRYGNDVFRKVGISIGMKKEDYELVDAYIKNGIKIINIDAAHGDSKMCVDMCAYIHNKYPDILIIAGNIATANGAERLWTAGADIVRAGIGNGSICSTRIETGCGVPQLTVLIEVFEMKQFLESKLNRQLFILSDGGASKTGDIAKALCFSDLVITGNMFAGCSEAPGSVISIDNKLYKSYVGSSTHKINRIEGVEALVPIKESYKNILTKMIEGIQSTCSYQGVSNLIDLKKDPQFIKISNAGLKESHAHDVQVIK